MSLLNELIGARQKRIPPHTNAYRVADGSPWKDIFIDAFADRLLVSLRDTPLPRGLRCLLEETGQPVYLKRLDKDNKTAPVQLCGPELPLRFTIMENGVRYWIDMATGYSQGLFLDQRDNRANVRRLCRPGMRLLNTFAYTGAFSTCAALGGAITTTLDLAQPCLHASQANMELNGIDPASHFFCKGDTLHWLERFARQGRTFDAIVLDPPTFSRDADGRIWRAERDYGRLARQAAACLSPHGWLLCTTNCRKLSMGTFRQQVAAGAPGFTLSSSPMPPDFDGEPYLKTIWCHR